LIDDDESFFEAIESPLKYITERIKKDPVAKEFLSCFKYLSKTDLLMILAYLFSEAITISGAMSTYTDWTDQCINEVDSLKKRVAELEKKLRTKGS